MGTLFIYLPIIFFKSNLPDRYGILEPQPDFPKPGNGNPGCVRFGAGLFGVLTTGPELPKHGSIESESE